MQRPALQGRSPFYQGAHATGGSTPGALLGRGTLGDVNRAHQQARPRLLPRSKVKGAKDRLGLSLQARAHELDKGVEQRALCEEHLRSVGSTGIDDKLGLALGPLRQGADGLSRVAVLLGGHE
jgi:hypothetical protein